MENNGAQSARCTSPSQTEIEPANQSYLNRSKARIGHLFEQMTNINRRGVGKIQ